MLKYESQYNHVKMPIETRVCLNYTFHTEGLNISSIYPGKLNIIAFIS